MDGKKLLLLILVAALAFLCIATVFFSAIKGEITRIERWSEDESDQQKRQILNPVSRIVLEENDPNQLLKRALRIECRRTGKSLMVTFNHFLINDIPLPPNSYAIPTSPTSIGLLEIPYTNDYSYTDILSSWSLKRIERGRYSILPWAWPQTCIQSNAPHQINFDNTLNYTGLSVSTHKFELWQSDILHYYFIRNQANLFLREVSLSNADPFYPLEKGILEWTPDAKKADLFLIVPHARNTRFNYYQPLLTINKMISMRSVLAGELMKSTGISTENESFIRNIDRNDDGTIHTTEYANTLQVEIEPMPVKKDVNWEYRSYKLLTPVLVDDLYKIQTITIQSKVLTDKSSGGCSSCNGSNSYSSFEYRLTQTLAASLDYKMEEKVGCDTLGYTPIGEKDFTTYDYFMLCRPFNFSFKYPIPTTIASEIDTVDRKYYIQRPSYLLTTTNTNPDFSCDIPQYSSTGDNYSFDRATSFNSAFSVVSQSALLVDSSMEAMQIKDTCFQLVPLATIDIPQGTGIYPYYSGNVCTTGNCKTNKGFVFENKKIYNNDGYSILSVYGPTYEDNDKKIVFNRLSYMGYTDTQFLTEKCNCDAYKGRTKLNYSSYDNYNSPNSPMLLFTFD